MFQWSIIALSLGIAWATEEAALSCAGESSLLQKRHRTSRQLHGPESNGEVYETVPENVLAKMIVSDPWKCDMLPEYDPRRPTCGLSLTDAGLLPDHMNELGNRSHDHKNTLRVLFPIGALPCCPTAPFCAAPACAERDGVALGEVDADIVEGGKSCTKRDPRENFDYMTSPDVWPAYHGWGGSFELDVEKHWDILGTALRQDGNTHLFDLVIDVGANSGYITEKLTARHFSKSYILIEAYEGMKRFFDTRLGDATWKEKWFTEQVPERKGAESPQLEFLNFAVNDHSEGTLDLCHNEMWSGMSNNVPCPVDKVAVDDVIPGRLSPNFNSLFSGAESAYIKIDVEGMDERALRGMPRILQEQRGSYSNGDPRYLVNFMMVEYCPVWMDNVKMRDEYKDEYDLKSMTSFLESMGFETFIMGPRYLPLSHGSWDDSFNQFPKDVENSVGGLNYPAFLAMTCPGPECPSRDSLSNRLSADIFAMRATHPMAAQIKLALGTCRESHDFNLGDKQYKTS